MAKYLIKEHRHPRQHPDLTYFSITKVTFFGLFKEHFGNKRSSIEAVTLAALQKDCKNIEVIFKN